MERGKSSSKRSRNDDRSNRDYDHHQRWSDQKSSGRDDRQNCRERKLSYGFRDDREGSRDEIDISRNPRIQIGSLNRELSGETEDGGSRKKHREELAVLRLDANFNLDAVKRALEIAAKLGFRRNPKVARTKAPILRVDALGREIDSHGNVVNLVQPSNLSTLKDRHQQKQAFETKKNDNSVCGAARGSIWRSRSKRAQAKESKTVNYD